MVGVSVGRSVGRSVGWLVRRSVGWLAGWLLAWLVGRSVGRLVGWLGGLFVLYQRYTDVANKSQKEGTWQDMCDEPRPLYTEDKIQNVTKAKRLRKIKPVGLPLI